MFKGNKKYLFIFFGLFALIIAAQYMLPKSLNWKRTYLAQDKNPFGCFAIHKLLNNMHSGKIIDNRETLYNLSKKNPKNTSVIIIADNYLRFNKNDLEYIFKTAEKGNKIFIASDYFSGPLADTFHLEVTHDFFRLIDKDSLDKKNGTEAKHLAINHSSQTFTYTQQVWSSSFRNFDSTRFSVLAKANGKACLIRTTIGKGELYLMSFPDAFGNYSIVNNSNRHFAYLTLSHLQNENIIWDEYYKSSKPNTDSFLNFIFKSDALYAAYLLMIFSILIYMFTEAKRKQRAIPFIEPVTNSTLDFVNVVSHVYFNNKHHQTIGAEKIKYFYETIRKRFGLNTNNISEEVIGEISQLSRVELKLVKQLFAYCEKIKNAGEISELELIELNRQINNFNKNSLR